MAFNKDTKYTKLVRGVDSYLLIEYTSRDNFFKITDDDKEIFIKTSLVSDLNDSFKELEKIINGKL